MQKIRYFILILIFSPVIATASAFGEETQDKELQEALSDDSKSLKTQNDQKLTLNLFDKKTPNSFMQKMNPDISFILDVGFGWHFAKEHYEQGEHAIDDNGFHLQGLEFSAVANVDPYFKFVMNFNLAAPEVHEVYAQTLSLPLNLQVKAGYLIDDFGRENQKHLHVWSFVNPSLAHTRFLSDEHFAGMGSELSCLLPLPWYILVSGTVLDTHSPLLNSTTFASMDKDKGEDAKGVKDFVYTARLLNFFELSDDFSLSVGASGAWGRSQYAKDEIAMLYGGDLYFKWRPLNSGNDDMSVGLTVEYFLRNAPVTDKDDARDHGGYAQIDFQIDRRWQMALRGDYAAMLKSDPMSHELSKSQRRAGYSITFLPSHFAKVRLQYDLDRDYRFDKYDHALYLQLEVSAGEHGAHSF